MSYDIQISDYDGNYTFNGAQLWYDIFGKEGIRGLSGTTGAEAEVLLVQFLIDVTKKYMNERGRSKVLKEISQYRSHPQNLKHSVGDKTIKAAIREYDAPNGWGSAFCQLNLILEMLVHSRENPEDMWGVFG
jgi:hypothetical protein|tara:strand:- start:22277 stop:22672 length:396 start_codon:yes stop_codon:yes gene_type:complete